MTIKGLKGRAGTVLVGSILAMVLLHLTFEGEAPAILLIPGITGSLALLVLLLATIADAMVETLKKKEK